MDETNDQGPDALALLMAEFPRIFRWARPHGSHLSTGWVELVRELLRDLDAMLPDSQAFEVLQIKEKFGTLRFYWRLDGEHMVNADLHLPQGPRRIEIAPDGAGELFTKIRQRVAQAEKQSEEVCELCGAPGTLDTKGGWKVRCPNCASKV